MVALAALIIVELNSSEVTSRLVAQTESIYTSHVDVSWNAMTAAAAVVASVLAALAWLGLLVGNALGKRCPTAPSVCRPT